MELASGVSVPDRGHHEGNVLQQFYFLIQQQYVSLWYEVERKLKKTIWEKGKTDFWPCPREFLKEGNLIEW